MLQLHTAPTSNGVRPRIMLEECGLEYELHVVDLQAGEHRRPEFLALNPLGLVPVLVSPEGPDGGELVMTQSMNMLIGLAYQSGKFLPKELADSRLRSDLTVEDFSFVDGVIPAPTEPGLGISLNEEAVERFQVA